MHLTLGNCSSPNWSSFKNRSYWEKTNSAISSLDITAGKQAHQQNAKIARTYQAQKAKENINSQVLPINILLVCNLIIEAIGSLLNYLIRKWKFKRFI